MKILEGGEGGREGGRERERGRGGGEEREYSQEGKEKELVRIVSFSWCPENAARPRIRPLVATQSQHT